MHAHQTRTRYMNTCLVLDDDVANQLCTDTSTGFSGHGSDTFIRFAYDQPRTAQRVHLAFRTSGHEGWAQIMDLKIDYSTAITNA